MRPRHYAAENLRQRDPVSAVREASMRPRHYAAENPEQLPRNRCSPARFNEAAALRRGKLLAGHQSGFPPSSFNEAAALRRGKRPSIIGGTKGRRSSFNEAAALRRGKPAGSSTRKPWAASFNEAAALRRGKQGWRVRAAHRMERASMRPRHYAAENRGRPRMVARATACFNEAAALRRGKPMKR